MGAGGLGLPQPPGPLAGAVADLGDGQWGTRRGAPGLSGVSWFADEFRRGGVDDYVLAGVGDVSTDLPAAHYFIVYGRLGLFVQAPLEQASTRLDLTGQVQSAALAAAVDGRLPGTGSLVVIDTPFGLHHWEWTPQVHGDGDGLEGAAAWLAALPPAP